MSRLVAVDLIDPSPWADLFPHDEEHVARLAEDIAERGIQTPLHAYPRAGRYELLAGHDRLEAARRAGLTEVPVDRRSMLATENERFDYFVRDNTMRKGVDKRAAAKATWLRYPKATVQEVAKRAGVSVGTAYNAREDAMREHSELFTAEKLEGADGKERPRTYAPREPKLSTDSPLSPEPRTESVSGEPASAGVGAGGREPAKVDVLRQQREAAAPVSAAFPEPAEPTPDERVAGFRAEFRRSPSALLSDFAQRLNPPTDMADEDIARAALSPAARALIEAERDFCDRVLRLHPHEEDARATA